VGEFEVAAGAHLDNKDVWRLERVAKDFVDGNLSFGPLQECALRDRCRYALVGDGQGPPGVNVRQLLATVGEALLGQRNDRDLASIGHTRRQQSAAEGAD